MAKLFVFYLYVMLIFLPKSYQESRAIPHETRILGGTTGAGTAHAVHRRPLVSVRYLILQLQNHICGGFIINQHWVGTGAQCLANKTTSNVVIAVGTTTVSGGTIHNINQIVPHPDYDDLQLSHDIGLLRTAAPINFSGGTVGPAHMFRNFFEGARDVFIFGWGQTSAGSGLSANVLVMNPLTMTTEQCQDRFPYVTRRYISDLQICTVAATVAACPGDVGGPLLIIESGQATAVGIVSWVEPCVAGQTNVHTRISAYYNWIVNITSVDN